MDLARQEYPALLTSLQPPQAAAVLNDRIRVINKVNVDIADWLQERRRVEELYVQGLRKLARRPLPDDSATLGIFQLPWKRIVTATESLAASHETLASKIEQDVERPLREYGSKNRDLSSMPSIHNDLVNLAKSLDAAQKRLQKAKEKRSKGADKAIAASSSLAEATQQWESRAPFVFEQLQSVDESRLNHLRDVLTQLQTHEADQVERSRQTAESCLNALLNVQTADEIKTFAAKIGGGRESAPLRRSSSAAAPPQPPPPAPVPTAPVNTPPPVDLPPPPRIQDDAASQYSNRSGRIGREGPPVPEPRQTPKMGGLRRLGTVMNRRKSVALGSGTSISGQEKKSRTGFSFRRGDSSRDVHTQLPSTPPGRDSPSIAGDSTASPPTTVSLRDPPIFEESTGITPIREATEAPVITNGTAANLADSQQAQTAAAQPQVDSEGFTEKPSTVDEITRAQREAAGLEESGLNLTIRDQPIHEDEEQAKQAMDDIANTLRMQGLQSGIRRNAGTIRGRRDVRNTMFVASSASPEPGPAISPAASLAPPPEPLAKSPLPPAPVAPAPLSQEDRAMSDTTSIHSSHTLHSISGPVSHPELHDPGLNASVVETVNSWFEGGSVSKSFVVGELALAYNAVPGTTPESSTIRLDNFALLEKVAANPHFVAEVSNTDDEKRGEYAVSLAKIARSIPTVAFKYQVHLPSTSVSSYSPIIFTPAWNLEEFQASAIIPYKVNPAFTAGEPTGSIILKNVVITVNLDLSPEDEVTKQPREVARATAAVMYPNTGAAFRRKQSAVVWKLPELEVKPDAENKLLVRFTTAVSWPRKGKVDTKFEYHTTEATSRLGISVADKGQTAKDPFADESNGGNSTPTPVSPTWKEVRTVRKLVAGKYVSS